MKKITTIAAAVLFTLGTVSTAFAGSWQGSYEAGWKWQNDDGTSPSNTWFWVDDNNDGIAESYLFDAEGFCLTGAGTTADGYTINAQGAWTENGSVMRKNLMTGAVFADNAGAGAATAAAAADTSGFQAANVNGAGISTNLADYQGSYEAGWAAPIISGENIPIYGRLEISGNTAAMYNAGGNLVGSFGFDPNGFLTEDGAQAYWNLSSGYGSPEGTEGILTYRSGADFGMDVDVMALFLSGEEYMMFFVR